MYVMESHETLTCSLWQVTFSDWTCQSILRINSDMAPHDKDQRIEIRFLWKTGLNAKQIHDRLVQVDGRNAVSHSTVQRWILKFPQDESVKDKPCPGRPKVRTAAKVQKLTRAVQIDKRSSVRELADQVKISKDSVHRMLRKDLHLKKKPSKWVPHLLTPAEKARHVDCSREALKQMQARVNPVETVVAEDESWFFCWDPERKQASMQWLADGEKRPEKPRIERTAVKVMLVIFFAKDGVIHREFVPRGHRITSAVYVAVLRHFLGSLQCQRHHLYRRRRTWALLHDGAPAHRAAPTVNFLARCRVRTLPHPGYSPDLSPPDYWIFARIKKDVQGRRFHNVQELQNAVDDSISHITQQEFADAMARYPERLRKCIAAHGCYFERD